MRMASPLLAVALCLVLAAPAFAQEAPAPAKDAPAAAAPVKEAAPEPPKELSLCAKALAPLAESYKKAYDDMQKWTTEVDSKTAASNEKVRKIQQQIQANETAITKAKLEGDSAKEKDLTKANKQLWSDLEDAKKTAAEACEGLSKEAADRVKRNEATIDAALDQCKAQLK